MSSDSSHKCSSFVAGSSVFPTGGCANPTFTIVTLAHRLADHLASRRSRHPSPSTQGST
jgi:choline dehydrogenase-like flavoprotein